MISRRLLMRYCVVLFGAITLVACGGNTGRYASLAGPPPFLASNLRNGSGFFIDRRGYILTADHVVADCPVLRVSGPSFMAIPAQVMARDYPRADLALVHINMTPPAIARLAPSWAGLTADPHIGGYPLRLYGYPESDLTFDPAMVEFTELDPMLQFDRSRDGGVIVYNPRVVSAFAHSPIDIDDAIWGVGTHVFGGFSGGPVVDGTGRVIGVISATARLSYGFAHVSDAAIAFLKRQGLDQSTAFSLPSDPALGDPGLSDPGLSDPAKSVVRISCYRPGFT